MAIFHCYVSSPEGNCSVVMYSHPLIYHSRLPMLLRILRDTRVDTRVSLENACAWNIIRRYNVHVYTYMYMYIYRERMHVDRGSKR